MKFLQSGALSKEQQMVVIWSILWLLFPCSVSAQSKGYVTKIPYKVQLPSLTPQIEVKFKQGGSATFVFDTGADCSIFSDSLLEKYKWKVSPLKTASGKPLLLANGKELNGIDAEYNLGSFPIEAPWGVMEDRLIKEVAGTEVKGVIGKVDIDSFGVLLDPGVRQISLYYQYKFTPEELQTLGFEANSFLSNISDWISGLEVEVTLNGKEKVKLTFDTGADSTLIPYEIVKRLQLKPEGGIISDTTLVGKMTKEITRLDTLQIGTVILHDVSIEYSKKQLDGIPARIGMNVLSHFRTLIDFPARKVYLKPLSVDPKLEKSK